MSKMEFVRQVIVTDQNVLSIDQFQIIALYEQLLSAKNIKKHFYVLGRHGYGRNFETKEGITRFTGCDKENIIPGLFSDLQVLFEWYLVRVARKMLADWHAQKEYRYRYRHHDYREPLKTHVIDLTHQQRGILTMILKKENKRKKLLKRCV